MKTNKKCETKTEDLSQSENHILHHKLFFCINVIDKKILCLETKQLILSYFHKKRKDFQLKINSYSPIFNYHLQPNLPLNNFSSMFTLQK